MNKFNYLNRVELILQNEELKRHKRAQLKCAQPSFTFLDIKGELFAINKLLPELQKALNSSDVNEVKSLCQLIGKRLNLIYLNFKA